MTQKWWKHPKLARALKDDLAHREALWKERRDPLAAWGAWHMCRAYELEPPKWLLAYLDACAERILEAWDSMRDKPPSARPRGWRRPTPRQREAAVARAFGFNRRGPESWLSNRLSLAGGMWATYQAELDRGQRSEDALAEVGEKYGGRSSRQVRREIALWERATPWARGWRDRSTS